MIVAAAVYRDGKLIIGRRHAECISEAIDAGWDKPIRQEEQGFVTDTGAFLSRYRAKIHAVACGQLSSAILGKGELLSEELW